MVWMLGYYLALMLNRWLIQEDFIPGTLGLWPVHLAVGVYAALGLRTLCKARRALENFCAPVKDLSTNSSAAWLWWPAANAGLAVWSVALAPTGRSISRCSDTLRWRNFFVSRPSVGNGPSRDTEQLLDAEVTLRLIVGVIPSLITVCALLMPVLYGGACLITGLWLMLA